MTKRNRRAAPAKGPSNLEQVVLEFLWSRGPCTSEAVREGLSRYAWKDATVRTLLRRLEEKGFVRHVEDGRAYVYSAVEKPRSLAMRALKQVLERFCGGSVEELVTGMVEHEVVGPAELRELARKLERPKRG